MTDKPKTRNGVRGAKQHAEGSMRQRIENKEPEKAATAIDVLTDPFSTLKEAVEASGIAPRTIDALKRRLKTDPLYLTLRDVKTSELLVLVKDRALRALKYLDDAVLSEAGAKDLAIISGILIEKAQLLSGEPTQRLTIDDRRELNELIPVLVEEAQRRGQVIDLTQADYKVKKGTDGSHV